jgi:hypothetical protein
VTEGAVEGAKMKKIFLSTLAIVPLMIAGCGGSVGETGANTENDAVAVAVTGGTGEEATESGAVGAEMQQAANAKVVQMVSKKVEEEVNAFLEEAEANGELEAMVEEDLAAGTSKDITVGLGGRGLSVFITDEVVPFAGGTMALDGEVGLKLRFNSWSSISLVASGELSSALEGVESNGDVRGIPYSFALQGSSDLDMSGAFTAKFRRFRIKSMKADLSMAIVESDVTATGSVGDKSVSGTVDMVDVALSLINEDVLNHPEAFSIECRGRVETAVNDDTIAVCELDPSCRGCK